MNLLRYLWCIDRLMERGDDCCFMIQNICCDVERKESILKAKGSVQHFDVFCAFVLFLLFHFMINHVNYRVTKYQNTPTSHHIQTAYNALCFIAFNAKNKECTKP
eukprot:879571_1